MVGQAGISLRPHARKIVDFHKLLDSSANPHLNIGQLVLVALLTFGAFALWNLYPVLARDVDLSPNTQHVSPLKGFAAVLLGLGLAFLMILGFDIGPYTIGFLALGLAMGVFIRCTPSTGRIPIRMFLAFAALGTAICTLDGWSVGIHGSMGLGSYIGFSTWIFCTLIAGLFLEVLDRDQSASRLPWARTEDIYFAIGKAFFVGGLLLLLVMLIGWLEGTAAAESTKGAAISQGTSVMRGRAWRYTRFFPSFYRVCTALALWAFVAGGLLLMRSPVGRFLAIGLSALSMLAFPLGTMGGGWLIVKLSRLDRGRDSVLTPRWAFVMAVLMLWAVGLFLQSLATQVIGSMGELHDG